MGTMGIMMILSYGKAILELLATVLIILSCIKYLRIN